MNKIDLIEELEQKDETESIVIEKNWRQVLEEIKKDLNNFDLNSMCQSCIEKQYALGVKNSKGEPVTTIECTGLNTYEAKTIREHGQEVFDTLKSIMTEEQLDQAEQIENPMHWLGSNISDKKVFDPRPHQLFISACSAKRKVLRMGRRCITGNTKIEGLKKNYSAKHLYKLFKNNKKLPTIYTFDDHAHKLVATDKYLIIPNKKVPVFKLTTSDKKSVIVSENHPFLVYSEKQYCYKELKDINIYYDLLVTDKTCVKIKSIKYVGVELTYHLSVVHYETFLTKGGIISHNTGKTYSMTVGMLHRLLTNKNYNVLMIAPMSTMIDEVVEQIKKFCDALEVNPIVTAKQTPIQLLEFNTGSMFKGVTAGAGGAKGARGKKADLLYVDECFPKGTKIRLADGSVKNIEDLKPGEKVLSYDHTTNKLVAKPIISIRQTGKKKVYTFKTVSGKKLKCTEDHPVLTSTGWCKIGEASNIATVETKVGAYFFESIISRKYSHTDIVYNFEVKDTHSYIADGFIVHNCDFLSNKDLNSIMGVAMDNPDTEMWFSSTPIGQGNLYQLGSDPAYKEFHFPSYVIPHYSDEIDAVNRRQMDEIGYTQEVLANYGATAIGVFQIKFIEQSTIEDEILITHEYILNNRTEFLIIIGVDWNHDKVGTRVVTVAYHKLSGRYFVVQMDRVALAGWTQLLAVEKIVDVNRKFNADHIYVDEGFGTTQASLLRQAGQQAIGKVPHNHPDLGLLDVKAVNFASTLVVRDPVNGMELKKQTKQYMVENAVNLLGRGLLVLRKDEDADIIAQMKNYIIKSVSPTGLKTYTYNNSKIADHDLDAYMIALLGFHTEYSEFSLTAPLGGMSSLVLPNKGIIESSDPSMVLTTSSTIIINTKQSILTNKFRRNNQSAFKTRKRW